MKISPDPLVTKAPKCVGARSSLPDNRQLCDDARLRRRACDVATPLLGFRDAANCQGGAATRALVILPDWLPCSHNIGADVPASRSIQGDNPDRYGFPPRRSDRAVSVNPPLPSPVPVFLSYPSQTPVIWRQPMTNLVILWPYRASNNSLI